jgi:hypothetical protein
VARSSSRDGSGVPALALAPVLIAADSGASIRTLDHELLDRATRPDYHTWLAGTVTTNGCVRPIRLRGTTRDINPGSGEIVRALDTDSLPDGVLYIPCGDRRASVCPACAETYRRDTYHLIRAGLTGGKGVPETVSAHPCVFATFTAPSLGPVHTRSGRPDGRTVRCRPRRKSTTCPHGRRMSCGQRHAATDTCLGRPLCADCYDYAAAVVWNVHAPELWRRTTIAIRRSLARTASAYQAGIVQLSYAKVAEFQARGLVHFHAIFRLDATGPAGQLTPPPLTADQLAAAIQVAAAATWFATVAHPAKPKGWDIRWGRQIDTQVVRLPVSGGSPNIAVASYLAKYATKSIEAVGSVNCRITVDNLAYYGNPRSHQGRLIRAAWHLGSHDHPDFQALRRWAHMLGYRGHFATKSRRYSTTLRALRQARADYRRRQHPSPTSGPDDQAVITITTLQWAGTGWRSSGDALLALSAAARARDHERAARDQAQAP